MSGRLTPLTTNTCIHLYSLYTYYYIAVVKNDEHVLIGTHLERLEDIIISVTSDSALLGQWKCCVRTVIGTVEMLYLSIYRDNGNALSGQRKCSIGTVEMLYQDSYQDMSGTPEMLYQDSGNALSGHH